LAEVEPVGPVAATPAGTGARVLRVRPGDAPPPASLVGGKAHNVARLAAAGAEVPPWIVVSADAFRELVMERFELPRSAGEITAWQERLRTELRPPPGLAGEIDEALREAGLNEGLLAVRSSALAEDGAAASFAGQFDTVLGVRAEGVMEAVVAVWASAGNEHALAYAGGATAMAVIVQRMVDARVAGVAFAVDPVSGDPDVAVVSAVWGLGEGLVSGDLDADTYRVRFTGGAPTVEVTAASKTHRIRLLPDGGSVREALPAELDPEAATLTDEEAAEIATQVRKVGDALGGPQDVEWAISDGRERRLYLLQARPITTLPVAPTGERRVWDNSNIVESYAGITSPLTFSFARTVYEDVYRQFCAVVGVPQPLIDSHRHVFANMLGLVRGRVYYNLLNWYRTLALLPGYALNRSFMERMMGVREKLSDPPSLEATSGRGADAMRMARMVARLIRESRGLRRAVPAFHARIDRALAPLAGEDLSAWEPDRLVRLYRELEEELLRNWQTPLVNDFFAMIWFGVLGRLVETWLPDAPPTLANDLLTNEGGIISAEPARRVRELARRARTDPAVLALFEAEPDASLLGGRLASEPAAAAFVAEVRAYLDRFGDRCMNELKLETITLSEDPSFLYQTIRGYIAADAEGERGGAAGPAANPREEAEARVAAALGGVRASLFRAVLAQTRARVRDRENLRFERTRVFGVVRRIFVGLGHQLVRAGRLDEPRDVFFLRVEELFGHVDGTAAGADLRALVRIRRAEWEDYERQPAPPDRFESIGPVAEGRWILPPAAAAGDGEPGVLRGIGCCPGVVRAPVRLVREPRDAGDLGGHILVAERTDPGWTLLFPAARGLLVERGSLLSHSAIVAREMALPCVVSIPALMATLRDGELVEMDGATGMVRRLDG
jgi:phosphohistidine swiveling domain-containing protein